MPADQKILVTSYTNPDIDGTGCCYAYAEFLRHKNIDAQAGFFGQIHREAQFVVDKFKIEINRGEDLINSRTAIVLLDASEILGLPSQIDPEHVIEIIDHRKSDDLDKFPSAKVQVEKVGACATLVAEKFERSKIEISPEAGVLLYSAIVSNTLNFKGKLTTERDKGMAEWLYRQLKLPPDYIHEMFIYKSKFTGSLKGMLLGDIKDFDTASGKLGIAQLEIIDTDKFVADHAVGIKKLLPEIKKERSDQYIFLNCLDLEKGYNIFVATEEPIRQILADVLQIRFDGDTVKTDHLIMRKEMTPLIKKKLSKKHD